MPRKHLISPESIQIQKELGNGEFGVVQQGVWIDKEQVTRQVAIKSLSKERMQNSTVEFMKEYEIMQTIRDDNIVSLFGMVFFVPKQSNLNMQYLPKSSSKYFLKYCLFEHCTSFKDC